MTLLQNPQLNDGDLELLSAYIDNQLAAGERGALEERLRLDPRLQAALEELRGTVAVLREIEPLPLPRSFTLDPAAFARRPSPLFGWLRLGATLASLLLAMTFAVDLVGRGGMVGTPAAPAAAPQSSDSTSAERNGFMQATAAPAAAAATAAPAAAEAPAMPAAPMPAAEPTAAILAAPAVEPTTVPAAAAGAPAATAAPAADAALPTQTTLPNADTQSSETTITEPEAPESAPAAEATPPPAAYSPLDGSTKTVPGDTAGGQAQEPAPPAQGAPAPQPSPQPAIPPLRLVQIGLASLVLLLGLAAIWVRRRGS
jgi:hypothetical protein